MELCIITKTLIVKDNRDDIIRIIDGHASVRDTINSTEKYVPYCSIRIIEYYVLYILTVFLPLFAF